MPKGISRVRFAGVNARTVTGKFNENGERGSLGGANQTITMAKLAAANPQVAMLRDNLNAFADGLGDNLYTGNLYQDISVQQRIYGAAFEYGLSERWNFGVRFRVVEQHIRSGLTVDATNNAGSVRRLVQGNAATVAALDAGLVQVSNFDQTFWENTLFRSKGYDAPSDKDLTSLGYTEAGVKYLIYKNDWYLMSTLGGVRLPTGRDESLTNPLDRGTGGNYWGAAAQWQQEFVASSALSFGTSARYDYYFKDTKKKAVPKNEDDVLPSLLPGDGQVQTVKRKPGNRVEAELSSTLKLGEQFSVWGAYQYQRKVKDDYSGPGNLYYAGLEKNTDFEATNGETGVEFSTIQLYRKKKFAMPMQVALTYNTTLSGYNTADASYGRVDLKFYF